MYLCSLVFLHMHRGVSTWNRVAPLGLLALQSQQRGWRCRNVPDWYQSRCSMAGNVPTTSSVGNPSKLCSAIWLRLADGGPRPITLCEFGYCPRFGRFCLEIHFTGPANFPGWKYRPSTTTGYWKFEGIRTATWAYSPNEKTDQKKAYLGGQKVSRVESLWIWHPRGLCLVGTVAGTLSG